MAAARPRIVDLVASLAYNALALPLYGALLAVAPFSAKLRRGLHGRRRLLRRLQAQTQRLRHGVWVHAASAGEYEQARPILRALRAVSQVPIYTTSFSPSGFVHARSNPESDHHDYMGWDLPWTAQRTMQLLKPRVLVFIKFDTWPNHVWAARRMGVPLLLLDASFPPTSRRARFPWRGFYRRLFDCFDRIGAISAADVERFRALGVRAPIEVTGDTKSEAVCARFEQHESGTLHARLAAQPWRYVTLGSIWDADLDNILPPLLARLATQPSLGLLAVPHEPTAAHVQTLLARLRAGALPARRLSELIAAPAEATAQDWRCIVVDSVGQLAEIYRASRLAYVGGGFGRGVHNVLEPAICSQPVLMGPRLQNAAEALALIEAGGARALRQVQDAEIALREWLDDEAAGDAAGARGRRFVLAQRGATERSLDLLLPYLAR